jgi:hypothetical protein
MSQPNAPSPARARVLRFPASMGIARPDEPSRPVLRMMYHCAGNCGALVTACPALCLTCAAREGGND